MTTSMAVPTAERTVCESCGHFHRPVLAKKRGENPACTCCKADAKASGEVTDDE